MPLQVESGRRDRPQQRNCDAVIGVAEVSREGWCSRRLEHVDARTPRRRDELQARFEVLDPSR